MTEDLIEDYRTRNPEKFGEKSVEHRDDDLPPDDDPNSPVPNPPDDPQSDGGGEETLPPNPVIEGAKAEWVSEDTHTEDDDLPTMLAANSVKRRPKQKSQRDGVPPLSGHGFSSPLNPNPSAPTSATR